MLPRVSTILRQQIQQPSRAASTSQSGTARHLRDPPDTHYTVQAGDTLWSIAKALYGYGEFYAALMVHNQDRLTDPGKIHVGDQLETPGSAFLQTHYPQHYPPIVREP